MSLSASFFAAPLIAAPDEGRSLRQWPCAPAAHGAKNPEFSFLTILGSHCDPFRALIFLNCLGAHLRWGHVPGYTAGLSPLLLMLTGRMLLEE